jgi:Fe-Mn family superoxide dismutase
MTTYAPKSFSLPDVSGISKKTFENHIKLYEGYVKHVNLILEKMEEYAKNPDMAYALGELQRRFSFEFDGMRNHEYYFAAIESGPAPLPADSPLAQKMTETWGSVDACIARLKTLAGTRGVGWAMLYYDKNANQLLTQWVDEQHLGHLTGLSPVVALDMWEHSYLMDYASGDKGKYVEAYLAALNWETTNNWFVQARA